MTLRAPCFFSPRYWSNCWEVFEPGRNEFYDMEFPECEAGGEIRFSKDGWVLMSPEGGGPLYFFNPGTHEKHQLPPVTSSFSSACCCFTAPPTSPDCCIFGIVGDTNCETEFALFKVKDEEWDSTWLNNCTHRFWPSRSPPLFHNGVYYLLDWKDVKIMTFDPAESRWLPLCDDDDDEIDEIKACFMVQVEGEIWGVFAGDRREEVEVGKLEVSEGRWKKVESLGDKCLYVSCKGCFAERCGEDSERANKIYFHGKSGVVFCLSTGLYHYLDAATFIQPFGRPGFPYNTSGAWVNV
ncbi:hypothetical protein ACS0TY_034160 [Phlomoides rotata]